MYANKDSVCIDLITIQKPCCSDSTVHLSIDGVSPPIHKDSKCHGASSSSCLLLVCLPVACLTLRGVYISRWIFIFKGVIASAGSIKYFCPFYATCYFVLTQILILQKAIINIKVEKEAREATCPQVPNNRTFCYQCAIILRATFRKLAHNPSTVSSASPFYGLIYFQVVHINQLMIWKAHV